jgi:uncharacterized protein (TIGR02231 family)
MKSIFTFVLSVLLIDAINASTEPREVSSQIKEVTVFLRGAQVTRLAKLSLQKGTETLIFRELPVNIDPQSIQARGEGNLVILSLLHQVNYLAGQRKTVEVTTLQDSLKFYEDKLALANGLISVSKSEEELLNANRDIGGKEKGVAVTDLKLAADFYRARLTELKKDQIKLAREAGTLTQMIEKLRSQLNTLNVNINKPTSEVLMNISIPENTSATIWLSYTVYDAGWIPVYDIRAKDILSPVELYYNAKIFQNTGEAWDKVSLRLSTANPQQRGEKPNLKPWFIDFEQPLYETEQYNRPRAGMVKKAYAAPAAVEEVMANKTEELATAASITEIDENQTNLEFNIKIPYDVPSDNKQYTINIQENTLPATYEYYCAPKLDREAFLVARITGWENYNLLPGEINLFFENTYVGKSNLNVRNTGDTLDLSLGRDKGIIVTRVKMKDFTEERTIGSNIRETRVWEITLRNNKKQALNLHLEDQFPVSMNKDIEVEPEDYSGGVYNKETGRISWKLKLEPSAEKKLRLSFAVKYPKDKKVFID